MSSKYERELRDILMGNEDTLKRVTRTMDERSAKAYMTCIDKPFLIMRGAGSLGIDLFAYRNKLSFGIEEKSCGGDKLYFSSDDRLNEQHNVFEDYAERMGLAYVYAYRQKGFRGEKWSVYRTEKSRIVDVLSDKNDLPLIPQTVHGTRYLSYNDGLPLSKYIEILRGVLDE